jgi:hypothetical protein
LSLISHGPRGALWCVKGGRLAASRLTDRA